MKQIKTILLLLTAAAMLFAVSACAPSTPEDPSTDTGTVSADTSQETDSATQDASSDVSSGTPKESDTNETTDSASDDTEGIVTIPLSPEDIAGTWTADTGEYVHIQIADDETVFLQFGDWNGTEEPKTAVITGLYEMGTNQWNILLSFDGGVSSVGYTLVLEDETSASFGKSGFDRQIYRFDPERQKTGL